MQTVLGGELFFAMYLGMVGVVFAMGEPASKTEVRVRNATLAFCAILAVVMILWLAAQILSVILER